jgi:Caspase domain
MKRIFLLTIFTCILNSTFSQKLYSVAYTGDNDVEYDCFMVYFNPWNCYMRVRFQNPDSSFNVIHVEYTSVTGKSKNKESYLLMKNDTTPTRLIAGDSAAREAFIPENFVWFTSAKKSSEKGPWATRDIIEFTLNGRVKYFPLKLNSITEADLLEFYPERDGDFEDIKVMCGLTENKDRFIPPLYQVKPVLHFIVAANTDEADIGESCRVDRDNLRKEMKAIADSLKIGFKPYVIDSKDFSRPKLLSKLNEVKPGSNDIVFFSYSGHGSRWDDQKDSFPYMALYIKEPFSRDWKTDAEFKTAMKAIVDNSMTVSELINIITQKSGRLKIILGDLCNDPIGANTPLIRPVTNEDYDIGNRNMKGLYTIKNLSKLNKLFMEAKGNVISVATKPMEKAGSTPKIGGYFTASFIEALQRETSFFVSPVSWDNIIAKTIDNAIIYKKNSGSAVPQTGIRSIKVK